jgi:hypothetical protein
MITFIYKDEVIKKISQPIETADRFYKYYEDELTIELLFESMEEEIVVFNFYQLFESIEKDFINKLILSEKKDYIYPIYSSEYEKEDWFGLLNWAYPIFNLSDLNKLSALLKKGINIKKAVICGSLYKSDLNKITIDVVTPEFVHLI